jgi:nucleotide-binding universal stress UspA family protein
MSIKDILLFLDDGKTNADRIELALSLARLDNANLTGVALGSMKPVHAPAGDGVDAIARMSQRMAEKLISEFAANCEHSGINTDTMIIYGDAEASAAKLAHYARNYDLTILSQPNPERDNYNHLLVKARHVMLLSGRPILFMPYIGAKKLPLRKAMIAWDGTPAASRSVHDAIPLLRKLEQVKILVVASKKQRGSKKEVLVDGLARHLGHHGINAQIVKINPGDNSVTSVIQNQITENNIDLLIMGGHGTPTITQKIFGTVTSNLLSSMVVPVLMSG